MERLPSSKVILVFLFLGIVSGLYFKINRNIFYGFNFYYFFNLVGLIFLNSLKMIVIPLIMSSLIYNISSFNSVSNLSGLGVKTITFYLFTSIVAILIGMLVVNTIQPGILNGAGAANIIGLGTNYDLGDIISSKENYSVESFFLSIFSGSIFSSLYLNPFF